MYMATAQCTEKLPLDTHGENASVQLSRSLKPVTHPFIIDPVNLPIHKDTTVLGSFLTAGSRAL